MANIITRRSRGTLALLVQPSVDFPEQPALQLYPGIPVRIHGTNGGYLFSLEADHAGRVIKFQDGTFHDRPGERLQERQIEEQEIS